MFGVRHRRRIVTVVVATWLASTGATGLPGSDMVLGAVGAVGAVGAAGAQTAGGPPALSWPDPAPPELVVPEVPAGDAVPDDWAAPVPAVARRPAAERVRELVDQRTATREVWENADGTRTAVLHSQPVFYQPAAPRLGSAAAQPAGGWEPIETALVADPERPGWLRTGANAWAVRFGPIEPGAVGGVEVETGAGRVRIVPDLAEGHAVSGPVAGTIAPVPGTGDAVDAVTYPNVWPGVDLVYRTTGATLRQQIVLREAGCETVRFVVEGLDLQETDASRVAQTVEVTGPQAGVLALQPLDVGRGADAAVPAPPGVAGAAMRLPAGAPDLVGDDPNIPGEPQFLAMSVAGAWLDRVVHAGEGPVVVGSTTTVGSTAVDTFRRLGAPTDTAAETLTYHDGLRVGRSSGDGQPLWRATARYDYWPFVEGRQVLAARLTLGGRADRNAYAATVSLRSAAAASFDGADGPPADGAGGPPVEVAPGTPGADGADDVAADVTDLLHRWQRESRVDGLVGLVGEEASPADTYLRFDDPKLEVTVNDVPAPPLLQAPAGDALAVTTTTPTLAWGPVVDPDGGTVTYTARIATGPDADSGLVVSSPPSSTATSWQVPAGVLRDGTVYYWRVFAGDGRAWTASEVRRLTVDSRLGVPATAPVDTVGAVTTNLASGNAFVRVPGASLPSASGSVDVDLVYNSATPRQGLTAVYREDANRNTEIDRTDPVRLARTDSQVSFAWRKPPGLAVPPQPPVAPAQSPAPGVPGQWFSAQWTGSLALPAGSWQLGARADDGVRIRLDDETVLDRWAMGVMPSTAAYQDGVVAGDSRHTIEVDYFQAFEGAGIELWVRSADDPSVAFVLPAGWLTPTSAPAGLPAGWSLPAADASAPYARAAVSEGTVTLFGRDGGAKAFTKTVGAPAGGGSGVPTELGSGSAGTAGYRPPPGTADVVTVGLDGSVTVQSPGGTTSLFRPDGGLRQVTSAAGDHAPLAAVAAYDSAGRLERLTDPVSGRSSILRYAPSPDCADAPELSGVSGLAAAGPGMLCRIDHWDGTSSSLHYAANGLLAYVRRAGEIWGFGYDASGRLSGYVDPLAVDATLAGAPEVSADAVDHVIGYDPTGRVVSVARPPVAGDVRRARSYAYAPATDASGLLTDGRTTITRSGIDGAFRVVGYDQRGRLVSDTDAAGATTTTAWNDDDQIVATDAPDGLRTTTSFDALGRPVTAWGPAPAAMFNVDGTGQDVVPRVTTGYDEQFDGLRVDYWINVDLVDGPVRHGFRPGTLSTLDWGTGSPAEGIPADGWGARLTGNIVFPEPGTYRLRQFKEGRARLFLDDTLVMDGWDTPSGWSADVEVTTVAPDEARRLRVDYAKSGAAGAGAPAGLEVLWTPPGAESPEPVPPSTLRPAFNLLTSTVNADGIRTERQWIDEAIGMGPPPPPSGAPGGGPGRPPPGRVVGLRAGRGRPAAGGRPDSPGRSRDHRHHHLLRRRRTAGQPVHT